MLRHPERGIPPHLLHLYADETSPTVTLDEGATRLFKAFHIATKPLSAGLRAVKKHLYLSEECGPPKSARHTACETRETQYLGETQTPDDRWITAV